MTLVNIATSAQRRTRSKQASKGLKSSFGFWLLMVFGVTVVSPIAENSASGQDKRTEMNLAENSMTNSAKGQGFGYWNVPTPTLGGMQFWSDQMVFGDWRIQKNVYTGHCRLLDPRNIRRAWGSYDSCYRKFDSLKNEGTVKSISGKAVVLLHGLGRTRRSMAKLGRQFKREGYVPINIEYASTRAPIEEHAHALHRILQQLEGIDEIHFVGHSMGNLVWRRYLSLYTDEQTGVQGDKRIRSSVMIAPPNKGAWMARVLKPTLLFGLVTGKSGLQLAKKDWDDYEKSLATPKHRFAIIAGKYNGNPLFRVDNDTTVSVDETKLKGAADFEVVRSMHAFIMANSKVIGSVGKFFEQGHLVDKDQVHPIR